MGYRPERKTYNLQFEAYPGLTVSVRGTSMGKLFELVKYQNIDAASLDEEAKQKIFGFFASRVITWNVEHPELETEEEIAADACAVCGLPSGVPLPTTVEGMFCLDLSFIYDIINGWTKGIAQVNAPKEQSSSGGGSQDLISMMKLGELQNH